MTATYNPALLTAVDWLRFYTVDTDPDAALLPDETYAALLAAQGFSGALASLCDMLAARYALLPSVLKESSQVDMRWPERVQAWKELATKARAGEIADPLATHPSVGGLVLDTSVVQQATPGVPVPTLTPPGPLGGFRSR